MSSLFIESFLLIYFTDLFWHLKCATSSAPLEFMLATMIENLAHNMIIRQRDDFGQRCVTMPWRLLPCYFEYFGVWTDLTNLYLPELRVNFFLSWIRKNRAAAITEYLLLWLLGQLAVSSVLWLAKHLGVDIPFSLTDISHSWSLWGSCLDDRKCLRRITIFNGCLLTEVEGTSLNF